MTRCFICASHRPRLGEARDKLPELHPIEEWHADGCFRNLEVHRSCRRDADSAMASFKGEGYSNAIQDAGVYRWSSNNSPVPDEIMGYWEAMGLVWAEERAATKAASEVHTAKTLEAYAQAQARRSPEQIAEQRADARAAMGSGVDMVDVITGERWTT